MNLDEITAKFLKQERISETFELLSSKEWKNLTDNQKRNIFVRINKEFCKYMKIESYNLIVKKNGIKQEALSNEYNYNNVVLDSYSTFYINDIDYNQYLTLYQYFFIMLEEIIKTACYTDYGRRFDKTLIDRWNKELNFASLGDVYIDNYFTVENALSSYQNIKLDVKKQAEKLLFEIIRRNYNEEDCFDEEYFMSNSDILINERLIETGNKLVNENKNEINYLISNLNEFTSKIEKMEKVNLNSMANKDLFIMIYPEFFKSIEYDVLAKLYNEIGKRILNDSISVFYASKKGFNINDNFYDKKTFSANPFNILLYECFREIDKNLRANDRFVNCSEVKKHGIDASIVEYKKKWLYKTIKLVDKTLSSIDFGILSYMPLNRLINTDNLQSNLIKSKDGNIPLKRGNR